MINSLSLLVAILVSLQCTFEANAQDNRLTLDNNLKLSPVPIQRHRVFLGDRLRFKEAPPSTAKLEPGKRLVITCIAIGKPLPNVHWMKNGEPMDNYEEESNEIVPSDPSSMGSMVSKMVVTTAASGDTFTCVASSRFKQLSASTTVYTIEGYDAENMLTLHKLFRLPTKPIITNYLESLFQNQGTDLVLPCRVHSFTKTQTFWQKNEKLVDYGHSRMQILPSGDLLVRNLQWNDMGDFTCTVTDVYGRNATETTFVYPLRDE